MLGQSELTISFLPKLGKAVTMSKRDIVWEKGSEDEPQCSKFLDQSKYEEAPNKKLTKPKKRTNGWQMIEMGKVSKVSQSPKKTSEEENLLETEQLPKREGKKEDKQ